MEHKIGRERLFKDLQSEAEDRFLYTVLYRAHCVVLDSAEYSRDEVKFASDVLIMGLACARLRGMSSDEALHNASEFHKNEELKVRGGPPRTLP